MSAGSQAVQGMQGNSVGNAPNTSAAFNSAGTSAGSRAVQGMAQGNATGLMQGSAGRGNGQMFGGTAISGQVGGNMNRMGTQTGVSSQTSPIPPGTYPNAANNSAAQRSNYAPNSLPNFRGALTANGATPYSGTGQTNSTLPNRYGNTQTYNGMQYNDRTAMGLNTNAVTPATPTQNDPNGWRYANHNGNWWYWMPGEYWMTWNGNAWNRYSTPTSPAAAVNQPFPVVQ